MAKCDNSLGMNVKKYVVEFFQLTPTTKKTFPAFGSIKITPEFNANIMYKLQGLMIIEDLWKIQYACVIKLTFHLRGGK